MNKEERGSAAKGFTLVELLVVIVIIGFLVTMATVYLGRSREQTINTKRLADIKQFQSALERYINDHDIYPTEAEVVPGKPLISKDSRITYMEKVPTNPNPRVSGPCLQDKDYVYKQGYQGKSYSISYCLTAPVYELGSGETVAMPTIVGVQTGICDCAAQNKPCCGRCLPGDNCGGGYLFAKNFPVGVSKYDLVVTPGNCNAANPTVCNGSIDTLFRTWAASNGTNEPADDNNDGYLNTVNLVSDTPPSNPAAQYCFDMDQSGFDDWYLPAKNEMAEIFNQRTQAGLNTTLAANAYYWSSNEVSSNNAYARYFNNTTFANSLKASSSFRVRCIRRF